MRSLLTFAHGVHPPERKELTEAVKVRRMPFPDEVVLPLNQHTGKPARLLVKEDDRVQRGDKVRRGQPIAKVGSSGNVARPQLHFEVRKGSRAINPRQLLQPSPLAKAG